MKGRIIRAIPRARAANTPFAMDGFFRDRKRNNKKRDRKNIQLVCDIIVDDIKRSQMERAPKMDAKSPAVLLNISLPRKNKSTMDRAAKRGFKIQGAPTINPKRRIIGYPGVY